MLAWLSARHITWSNMRLEITEDDLQIRLCPNCRGSKLGITPRELCGVIGGDEVACESCGGRGVKLTPTGAKLYDFVREVGKYD